MQQRLSMDIRAHVLRALKADKFEATIKEVYNREYEFAQKTYEVMYTQEHRDLMLTLPAGWLQERSSVTVAVDGQYHSFAFSTPVRFPYERDSLRVSGSSPLGKSIRLWCKQKDDLETHVDQALSYARSVLASHRTVAALLKTWPEVEPYLPATPETVVTTALAIPMKALNKMLGLP